jgi:membrane protease subunit HflK
MSDRKLVQIAASREAFRFMTDDRQAIADALRNGIQAEVDRYNLGLEITFVGLKDIHPPVTVAPAYQKVLSAQEEKEAMIDDALAYKAHTIPLANSQAYSLTVAAQTAYESRVDKATGESSRFESILAPERIDPALFRLRLKYDMLDQTLPRPSKTIIGTSSGASTDYYLDLRTGTNPSASRGLPIP